MQSRIVLILSIGAATSACQTIDNASVVAVTGTTIGLEIGQSPANATPGLTFGYNRAEVAVVSAKLLNDGTGNEDVANVLMELRYASGSENTPGVYQRLAVGKTAVSQAGASLMFAKSSDGTMDANAAAAIKAAIDESYDPDKFQPQERTPQGENAEDPESNSNEDPAEHSENQNISE